MQVINRQKIAPTTAYAAPCRARLLLRTLPRAPRRAPPAFFRSGVPRTAPRPRGAPAVSGPHMTAPRKRERGSALTAHASAREDRSEFTRAPACAPPHSVSLRHLVEVIANPDRPYLSTATVDLTKLSSRRHLPAQRSLASCDAPSASVAPPRAPRRGPARWPPPPLSGSCAAARSAAAPALRPPPPPARRRMFE